MEDQSGKAGKNMNNILHNFFDNLFNAKTGESKRNPAADMQKSPLRTEKRRGQKEKNELSP